MRRIQGALLIAALGLAVTIAVAQEDRGRVPAQPPQGINGKTFDACRQDVVRFCTGKALVQECLVRNWDHISGECQDGLARPMRGSGG